MTIPKELQRRLDKAENSVELLYAPGDCFESLEIAALHEDFDEDTIRRELVAKTHYMLFGNKHPQEVKT